MRLHALIALGLSLGLGPGCTSMAGQTASGPGTNAGASCPTTTEAENIAIARVWHEEVINRRNPAPCRTSSTRRSCTTRPAATPTP